MPIMSLIKAIKGDGGKDKGEETAMGFEGFQPNENEDDFGFPIAKQNFSLNPQSIYGSQARKPGMGGGVKL